MIGTVLGNRYEIIEKIGGGGMALVYKARCRLLNRNVAIKILRDEFINDEEFIKRFRRESQAAASLSHPNIVNIYDVGVEKKEDHNIQYIVMEYIRGKTLKEIIRIRGKLTIEETIDFSIQMAEALQHAHKNHIVHRDIKPHNIMITEDGRVKVTDFGIARAATASTVTNTSNVIGSVHYFSPEQARGGYTDEKSDIYSLGIVMYEMITGKVPFEGDSPVSVALKHIQEDIIPPRNLDNNVPVALQNIILRCVKKSQVDRYNSISHVLRELKIIKTSSGDLQNEDYNIMDEATQIISIGESEDGEDMRSSKKGKKEKKDNGGLKIVLLAILSAFIVVSSLAIGFFTLKDYFITSEVDVPHLVGMYVDEATDELEKIGLNLNVVNEIFDSEFEKGQIIQQRTDAGERVKENFTIEVITSKGRNLVMVPDLLNKNINEIDAMLSSAKLSEGMVDYEPHDSIEANKIIGQNPSAYSEVEEGTKIDILVSQGPKVKTIVMPRLIGLSEQEARNALSAYELLVGVVKTEPNNELEEGLVFWQGIEPGIELETGSTIDIYISEGAEEEPEHVDREEEIPFNITLTLAVDDEELEIRVVRIQDGDKEIVYDRIHEAEGQSIRIPVKGRSDARFEIYYNNQYIDTILHPEG